MENSGTVALIEQGLRQSEERYRFLADAVPHIIWTAAPNGANDYCNKVWFDYTGLSPTAPLMDGWKQILHPEDLPAAERRWANSLATGAPFEIEYRFRRYDGVYRWHLGRCIPRRDTSGQILQWVGSATDIDDRKQAEASVRKLLNQLDAIIGNMNEGLAVGDAAGNLLSMNNAGLKMHGYLPGEDYRRRLRNLPDLFDLSALDGTPLPPEQWPLARTLRGETFSNFEIRLHYKPSGKRWVANYAGSPIRNASGQIEMVIVTFRDVTAQKQIEADLASAKEYAETANRMKDEFLATLSHELRTPLNAILGWTQLLMLDSSDPADLKHGLETIERNARVQTQLVEDLLDVSRIISGKVRLSPRPINLRTVLDAARDAVRPAADARGVRLEPPGGPEVAYVSADPDRLQQVIWNLLSNAIKFTARGGHVRTEIARIESHVDLIVTDSGQGISAEFLPHVFERFRQADGSISRSHGGLGLGLAIVRHLVELHGGSVRAQSEGAGKGSVFTVSLPTAVTYDREAPELVADSDSGAPPRGPVDPSTETPGVLRGIRVLLVDDEPDARSVVTAVLKRQHAEVTAVSSAAEVLDLLPRLLPDILISDIGMPNEDGYGLIRKVRQLPPHQGGAVPAVALTAYARIEDRALATDAGFQVHLNKPVKARLLIDTVAGLIGRLMTPNP